MKSRTSWLRWPNNQLNFDPQRCLSLIGARSALPLPPREAEGGLHTSALDAIPRVAGMAQEPNHPEGSTRPRDETAPEIPLQTRGRNRRIPRGRGEGIVRSIPQRIADYRPPPPPVSQSIMEIDDDEQPSTSPTVAEAAFGVPTAQLPQSDEARDYEAGTLFQELEQGPEASHD